MWIALRRAGEQVGHGRVARLMGEAGVQGAKRRGRPWRTTTPNPSALRRPDTDRGSRYTSADYTQELNDHGVLASVGTVGDAYDNAMAESFVDTFKTELLSDRVWRTRSQLELAVVEYVSWFNNERPVPVNENETPVVRI